MPSARCSPVPESPICAPVTSGGPSSNPVVDAAPPAHCATFSYTLQSSYGPGPKPLIDAMIMRGLMSCTRSQEKPMRSSAPGAKFSTSTSHSLIRRVRISLPFGSLVLIVMDRLLWFSIVKYRLSTPSTSRSCPRVASPSPAFSTLITSAPNQPSNWVQVGPDWTWVKSRILTPSSALLIAVCSLRSWKSGARSGGLLLGQGRVEAGDAAAFGAGVLVDHGVDQRRLARLDGFVQRLLQLFGRLGHDADAAERLHHQIVARALDELRGRHRVAA